MTTSHLVTRRSRFTRGRHTLVLAVLAAISVSACGGAGEIGQEDTALPRPAPRRRRRAPAPRPRRTPAPRPARQSASCSATPAFARLDDNATARELAGQLPLTLTVRDHNGVEKTAPLPRPLVTDGAPEGHDPAAGDIGYYAPAGDVVLYYDDEAPYFSGIVRIGEFDGDLDALRRLADGSSVTVRRAP
jgi:hypothetical protein